MLFGDKNLTKLDSFLGQLETVNKAGNIQGMIEALQNTYSVANVVYHALNLDEGPFVALTYSRKWMAHYQNKKYIRVDPVVKKATQQFHPLDWNRLDWSSRGSKAFLGDAISAGVGNQGLSIPIRGRNGQFALFTINDNESDANWSKFVAENQRDMMLISHHLHQKANEILCREDEPELAKLSVREADALTYLSRGLNRAKVAEKMQISEHTLRVYIDAARHKLGGLNLIHAISIAQSKSLIMP